jgi:hypothetical protein
MHIEEMEEGEGASIHDKEAKGQNTKIDNVETKVQQTQGPRGPRNIARNCEEPENRNAEL